MGWTLMKPVPPPKPFKMQVTSSNKFCLDLYGGKTDNGTPIDIWECGQGVKGQEWYFRPGSFQIQSVIDPKKCIDAGKSRAIRNKLMLWDCDSSLPQQTWGFDEKSGTIF